MTEDLRDDRYTRKARRDALHADAVALAERLVAARDEWLVHVPLDGDPELAPALELARRMKSSGARNRQVRHVARLLLQVDEGPIQAALDAAVEGITEDVDLLHAGEAWRDRIVAEGDGAIAAFLAEHPAAEAERGRLRQLARQAAKDVAAGKPARSRRVIYRLVRGYLAGEGGAADPDDADPEDD